MGILWKDQIKIHKAQSFKEVRKSSPRGSPIKVNH